MEHKTTPGFLKQVDTDQGIVEHIFAVMGVVDHGKDIILPGAFKKTLQERGQKVRVLDNHNTFSVNNVVAKPLEIRELSRDELPATLLDNYPSASGGVYAKTQFLLDTDEGAGAFKRIKAGAVDEWSFGYDAVDYDYTMIKGDGDNGENRVRQLKQIRLWEYSPVLWGMNPATATISAKKEADSPEPEEGKPWVIVKEGEKWVVYKEGADGEPTGDPLGEHDTEEEAQAQLRALYAAEEDEKSTLEIDELKQQMQRLERAVDEIQMTLHALSGSRDDGHAEPEAGSGSPPTKTPNNDLINLQLLELEQGITQLLIQED